MSIFFELLQVALGRRERLSRVPLSHEWEEIYEVAEKQGIVGLLLSGLEHLPAYFLPPLELKLQWIGDVQMDDHLNKLMDQRCLELLGMLEKAGLQGTILKGQGIARLYDEDLSSRRQPGDIDVYVDCGLERAIAFAQSLGQKDISWDYKHLHLQLWEDTEVELHYRVEVMFDLMKNHRLQRWFDHELNELYEFDPESGFVTPSVEFNVFYILLHIYRHFFTEGVGLRQIMDYYFVLKTHYENKTTYLINNTNGTTDDTDHTDKYCTAVSEFGMERFAKGLMWVMLEVMAMPKEWMLWEPDEKEGRYILEQVMEGGNFGHYSKRQTRLTGGLEYVVRLTRHSLHLMRRYPTEAVWIPVWMVWHKLWKVCHS